jgi:hypothetical protein
MITRFFVLSNMNRGFNRAFPFLPSVSSRFVLSFDHIPCRISLAWRTSCLLARVGLVGSFNFLSLDLLRSGHVDGVEFRCFFKLRILFVHDLLSVTHLVHHMAFCLWRVFWVVRGDGVVLIGGKIQSQCWVIRRWVDFMTTQVLYLGQISHSFIFYGAPGWLNFFLRNELSWDIIGVIKGGSDIHIWRLVWFIPWLGVLGRGQARGNISRLDRFNIG